MRQAFKLFSLLITALVLSVSLPVSALTKQDYKDMGLFPYKKH